MGSFIGAVVQLVREDQLGPKRKKGTRRQTWQCRFVIPALGREAEAGGILV